MNGTGRTKTVRGAWARLGAAALLAGSLLGWQPAAAGPGLIAIAAPQSDAIVRCEPASASGPYQSDLTLDLYVQDAAELYGVDLQLTFDPAVAQVVDDNLGAPGVQITALSGLIIPEYVVKRVADNTAGTVWYAATQLNPTLPVTGSGAVARLTLHPLTYGSFDLVFTNAKLARADGTFLAVTAQNCPVSFYTPLPTTTAISPVSALAPGAAFSLTVTGTNFISGTVVQWGGLPVPTTFISATQLVAAISAGEVDEAGPIGVTVLNPAPGGGESNAQGFTVFTSAAFSAAGVAVSEAAGAASFEVQLQAPSSLTVSVGVSSTPGTAGSADYTPLSTTLTFSPGQITQTVAVSLTNDLLDEDNETFQLSLTAPQNTLLGSPATATATILDDDSQPTVQFATAAYTVSESAGSAPVTVTLSAASGLTVTVALSTTPGTAGLGDHTPANLTLTFAPGTLTQTAGIAILNDLVAEPTEALTLSLGSPTQALLGALVTASLTISDDEHLPTVQFTTTAVALSESAGQVSLGVVLSLSSQETVTVAYATTSGTAGSLDYVPVSGTLVFAPGELTRTLTVTLTGDLLDELSEAFTLTLSAPTQAGLGAAASAAIMLLDDDPPPSVQFADAGGSVGEAAGSALITVTLSAPSALTVTVGYSTGVGSATAGDYVPLSGMLTFAPGQTTRTLTLVVLNDSLDEPNETVPVLLQSPVNASLGAPTTFTLTLVDEDEIASWYVYVPLMHR